MSISQTDMPEPFRPEIPNGSIESQISALLEPENLVQMPGENPVAIVRIGNTRNPELTRSSWAIQQRQNPSNPERTDTHMVRLDTCLPGPMPTTSDGQHIVAERVIISEKAITLDREVAAAGREELVIRESDMQEALSSARPLTLAQRMELVGSMSVKKYETHVPKDWGMGVISGLMLEREFATQLAEHARGKRASGLLGRFRRRNNQ